MGSSILFIFYRYLVAPLATTLFFLIAPFNSKLSKSLKLRRRHSQHTKLYDRPVWIHASSGEFEYAKSVIRTIKEEHPKIPILVTYFSPSYSDNIQKFPGVDHSQPLPLDLPTPVNSFLAHYKPRALLVARTDLWPEVLLACKKKSVPVLLFATTFRPLRGLRKLTRPYFRFLFQFAQDIFCVSKFDKDNLSGLTKSSAMGDPRYDQVAYRLSHKKINDSLITKTPERLTLVCGSTWPEDEAVLLPIVIPKLKNKELRLIIAPHEVDAKHITNLHKEFTEQGLTCQLFSELTTDKKWLSDILIVDKMGVLADLYAYGELAFVGGSFRAKVHSVMEPLGTGCVTLVGPFCQNNREATEFSSVRSSWNTAAVHICPNAEELKKRIQFYIDNKNILQDLKYWIRSEFKKKLGATQPIINWLKPYL